MPATMLIFVSFSILLIYDNILMLRFCRSLPLHVHVKGIPVHSQYEADRGLSCIIILIKLDSIIRIRVLCKTNVTRNGNKHYITRHDTRSKHVKNWPPISSNISAIIYTLKQPEPLSFTGKVDQN